MTRYNLKPCPFCGSTDLHYEYDYDHLDGDTITSCYIRCFSCLSVGGLHTDLFAPIDFEKVAKSWNCRIHE